MPPARSAQMVHEFARVFGARLPLAMALITLMEHPHLREPHVYIPYLGVAPRSQGQGLGTALLRGTLDRCDGKRLPAYLEATSERNVALYERLGFRHLSEFKLGSSPTPTLARRTNEARRRRSRHHPRQVTRQPPPRRP
jgi:ribosomal protein S18 acetylase RimI-like enzyme